MDLKLRYFLQKGKYKINNDFRLEKYFNSIGMTQNINTIMLKKLT